MRDLEGLNQVYLDFLLGLPTLGIALKPEVRPLHHEDIHIWRRFSHELLEDAGFPTVPLEIGRVEQPAAIRFNEQGVRVESAVVVEERRDCEGTERERFSVPKKTCWIERHARGEECGFLQDPVRRLTNVDRDVLRHLVDQSPMILMSMRDDETEQRGVRVAQPGHVRQWHEFVSKRIQRPANVEDNSRPG
jgi:hypothetical protein